MTDVNRRLMLEDKRKDLLDHERKKEGCEFDGKNQRSPENRDLLQGEEALLSPRSRGFFGTLRELRGHKKGGAAVALGEKSSLLVIERKGKHRPQARRKETFIGKTRSIPKRKKSNLEPEIKKVLSEIAGSTSSEITLFLDGTSKPRLTHRCCLKEIMHPTLLEGRAGSRNSPGSTFRVSRESLINRKREVSLWRKPNVCRLYSRAEENG